jgi:hypothetical protein
MQISDNTDSTVFPQITIATYSKIETPDGVSIINIDDLSEPKGFNKIIQQTKSNLWGFVPPNCSISKEGIKTILSYFKKYPHINYLYTDIIINNEPIYWSSYSANNSSQWKQVPLFIKQIPALFEEKLNYLYFYLMLLRLENCSMGLHIAEPLFNFINYTQPTKQQIDEELAIIYGTGNTQCSKS